VRERIGGLYAITPASPPPGHSMVSAAEEAIRGGARLIQYRDKGGDARKRRDSAAALVALCRSAGVPLIINDDVELTLQVGADGVHLGRHDGDPRKARTRLGPGAILGVSCYDDLELAVEAERAGASYVAFGSFFPSATKPGAVRPPLALLTRARQRLGLPLVAIGGITPENAGSLIAAGAHALAVVSGVFEASDIAAAAGAYACLFPTEDPR